MDFSISPGNPLRGEISLPGDKSISHRALMCASLANGTSNIKGFLNGEDCLTTLDIFSKMGVKIKRNEEELEIDGVGLFGLSSPNKELDFRNSGTAIRLVAGIMVGQKFPSRLVGDSSLSLRPMERIVQPLLEMGANMSCKKDGTPPIVVHPVNNKLSSFAYELPIPSAQVKSCLMFASLYSEGPVVIKEKIQTRDHTEKMFESFKVPISISKTPYLKEITIRSNYELKARDIEIGGDFSSASFFIVATLINNDSHLIIRNVGVNETRTGLLTVLKEMGADIKLSNFSNTEEPTADIEVKSSKLHAIEVDPDLIPNLIDELPIFFIAAASAEGITSIKGAEELRLKESDRLFAMSKSLEALEVKYELFQDGINIHGKGSKALFNNSDINSFGDHRIAMASAIACTKSKGISRIMNCDNVNTSFPNFVDTCCKVGLKVLVR